jgi:hypothetical protein
MPRWVREQPPSADAEFDRVATEFDRVLREIEARSPQPRPRPCAPQTPTHVGTY